MCTLSKSQVALYNAVWYEPVRKCTGVKYPLGDLILTAVSFPRICHCEGDEESPLITPCRCTGTLRFVHQSCLHQWIKSSDTRCCELCKYDFIMETKLKPLRKVWYLQELVWKGALAKQACFKNPFLSPVEFCNMLISMKSTCLLLGSICKTAKCLQIILHFCFMF